MPRPPATSTATAPEQDLRQRLRVPSFTPALRQVDALIDLLGDPEGLDTDDAERALLRVGPPLLPLAEARFAAARPPLRGRLCRLIGRLAQRERAALPFLLSRLRDEDDKTRRNAIIALGALATEQDPLVERALIDAWHEATRIDHCRSIAAALGKAGGAAALALLQGWQGAQDGKSTDPELRRIVDQAALMLQRTLVRPGPAAGADLRLDRAADRPLPVVLRCRPGLEHVLLSECPPELAARIQGPGALTAVLHGPPAGLLRMRTLLDFGFPLPPQPLGDAPAEKQDEALAEAIAGALTGEAAQEVLGTFTAAPPARFRLALSGAGHRRALVWRTALLIARRSPLLRNDPTGSPWEAVSGAAPPSACSVTLFPRRYPDPRFAYRQASVPAASHPTVAAALARIAGANDDDVVWDPFVGSGLELIERALLGPCSALYGTDLDPAALDAARQNLAAAGVAAELSQADARHHRPRRRPTLILTNPPMGRRVQRGGDLAGVLTAFVRHAAMVLQPGGRLVWLSPLGQRTRREAAQAGLVLSEAREVDMGGFTAELQVLRRPP